MSFKTYLITRVLLTIPTILVLTTIVFVILHIIPGDPINSLVGLRAPESLKASMRHEFGLDKPLYAQYFSYIVGVFSGQLGISFVTQRPIASELASFFPATVELALGALIVTIGVGIPLGLFSAIRANSKLDITARIYSISIYTIPVFWLGLILQLIFGVYLRILPIAGMGTPPRHIYTGLFIIDSLLNGEFDTFVVDAESLILPAISLGLIISGVICRLTRAYMVDSLSQDYTTTARGRGLKAKTIILSYGLKNALIPLITIIGLQAAALLGGAILTETTFSWPGVGLYLVQRIALRDYNAIQGAVVLFAISVVLVNLVVDLLYGLVDPRVRL